MCLKCCLQMDNSIKCPGHMAIKQKKEGVSICYIVCEYNDNLDEERYIEEGMNKRRKKTRDFLHVENRLQFYNQTVVIWCLEDFLRNKRLISFVLYRKSLIVILGGMRTHSLN